ncbi:putative transmembrane fatty acid synthesis protein [Hyphomicrobium sp. MC1]|nr:putative transmembrane fatty acid synthesis protein [Hyphomicrobium sp. MC1]
MPSLPLRALSKSKDASPMTDIPAFLSTAPRPLFGFFPVALVFIAVEILYMRLAHHADEQDGRETVASIGVAVGDLASRILTGGLVAIPMLFCYRHRLFDIPLDTVWSWIALFLGVEFFYYWFHRASHQVRWFWATHAVHHSATHFNLSAAIRLGWTGVISGAFLFFLPLALIGFHPAAIGLTLGLGLVYQFFLHTAVPVRLGPLERVLNTPAHHRVHHASNETCLDKNYGSVLIVFDRLFGSFAAEPAGEALKFGLKGREPSTKPLHIALSEWGYLWRDFRNAPNLSRKIRVLFGAP